MGTIRRIRDYARRRRATGAPTREPRERLSPTEHGHAALRESVIREYQSDSSSKHPVSPSALGARGSPAKLTNAKQQNRFDKGRSISA